MKWYKLNIFGTTPGDDTRFIEHGPLSNSMLLHFDNKRLRLLSENFSVVPCHGHSFNPVIKHKLCPSMTLCGLWPLYILNLFVFIRELNDGLQFSTGGSSSSSCLRLSPGSIPGSCLHLSTGGSDSGRGDEGIYEEVLYVKTESI